MVGMACSMELADEHALRRIRTRSVSNPDCELQAVFFVFFFEEKRKNKPRKCNISVVDWLCARFFR